MKYNTIFGIALVCAMLFTACDDIIEILEFNAPVESGYGRISVNLTTDESLQTERTVLPSITFTQYEYTFTKADETDGVIEIPDYSGFFTLEIGNYTVAVRAFIGNEGSYTLAAHGISSPFSVGSDSNDPVVVHLTAVDTEGENKGEFIYTITYPNGASAEIKLMKWSDMGEVTLAPLNLTWGIGITQTLQLDAGSYLLTVIVNKDNLYAGISEAVHIKPLLTTVYTKDFTDQNMVAAKIPLSTDYDISGTGTFIYDGSERVVSITPKDNVSPGAISVYYEGTDDTVYEKTTDAPVDIGTYTVTFDVAAVTGWSAATGLPAGIITIDVPPTPTTTDYNISGTGAFFYDGNEKVVSITPKEEMSPGAISVYYEGIEGTIYEKSTDAPVDIGTYIVTFDVVAAQGWSAVTELPAGTITIEDPRPSAPRNLTAVAGVGQVTLSWAVPSNNGSSAVTGYQISWIPSADTDTEAETIIVTGTSQPITNLDYDTSYTFSVFAINDAGNGPELTIDATTLFPIWGISLSQTTAHTFSTVGEGYGTQAAWTITVTNTGNVETGALVVELSGTNTGSFVFSTTSLSSINSPNGTATFTITPQTGLAVGEYTATVTVAGDNGISEQFNVSFTVETARYSINLSQSGIYTFSSAYQGYAQQTARTVTVNNNGNLPTNTLSVALSGTNSNSFTVSTTSLSSLATYGTTSFTIRPNTGLVAGTYTATITVSGSNGISASFNVSFTVNTITSIADVTSYLNSASGGQNSDDPVPLPVVFDLGTMTSSSSNWQLLLGAIQTGGKFVALDLSACTMSGGTTFNAVSTVSTGKILIVSMVLPTVAQSIASSSGNNFSYLRSVSAENVTSIMGNTTTLTAFASDGAFYGCTALTSVSFPQVTNIQNFVFYGCTSLTSVSIPAAATIGSYAFSGCTSLATVNFPEATSLGSYIFNGCTSLTSVTLPKATDIPSNAFYNCSSLTTLTNTSFPVATSIGSSAFVGCSSLRSVTLPSVTTINGNTTTLTAFASDGAFYGCTALTSVSFPQVTNIQNFVFYGCTSLTSVNIPVVATIGSYAFSGCTSLTTVNFPEATSLGSYIFNGCTNLSSVTLPKATDIPSNAFYNCTNLTTLSNTSFPVATSIGSSAFYGCTKLQSVSFPSVTTINGNTTTLTAFASDGAFYGCTVLTSVTLPQIATFQNFIFSNTGTTALTLVLDINVPPTVGVNMFNGVTAGKTVTVKRPSGATSYGSSPTDTTTNNWGNALRGKGWTQSNSSYGSGTVNSNVTVIIENL